MLLMIAESEKAMSGTEWLAIAVALATLAYTAIQILDRLYPKAARAELQPDAQPGQQNSCTLSTCNYDGSRAHEDHGELKEAVQALVQSSRDMNQSIAASNTLADRRHEELMRNAADKHREVLDAVKAVPARGRG